MSNSRRIERVLDFDLNSMQQRAYTGVRRAAAFLGLSERFLEGEFPRSLTLGRNIRRQFLPDPFPAEQIPELRENWQAWITGNALRELDQFLSLYLDEAFDKVQQAKLVSGEYPPHHQWKRLDGITNVAAKHQRTLEAANRFAFQHLEDQACLASLSHVRNCLSHDLGVVTAKRAENGVLSARWLAFRTIIEQGDNIIDLEELSLPVQLDPEGPEGTVMMRVELAERHFSIGEHIRFWPDELLRGCLGTGMERRVDDRVET